MPVYKYANRRFFKKWSPEMAYVLGFFCADGTITVNPWGSEYFVIQIADEDLLKQIRKTLTSEHKISKRIHKKDKSVFYRLQIGSKEMCNDLRILGAVEKKTYRLILPDIPKKYFGHFVRGYFDGDGNVWTGYVHKERKRHLYVIQTGFTSCSQEFLNNLKNRLTKIGIQGSLYPRKNRNVFRLQYSIKSSILLYQLMYNNICSELYLERKKKVFNEYISTMRW